MKKTGLIILFTWFLLIESVAQVNITGTVIDKEDRQPLPNAIVILKNTEKGNAVKFVQADTEGKFTLSTTENESGQCYLSISMMSYKTQQLPLNGKSQYFLVEMKPNATQIKEIIVKAQKIKEQGDTITYNVASFANKQDKNIGEVMKKMPGIDVAESGKIQYNGVDINKFYIEGKDMLDGKYGIATNGISPEDVGSIEIMENHQPLRVLQNVSISSQAAINLRLKANAKSKWILNTLAAGGASTQPEGGLWMGELFAMQMKQSTQNITLYKTNNTGKSLGKEITDFIGSSENNLSGYINVTEPQTPNLEKKRTLFNRSHLLSTSQLWGMKNDWEIKTQIDYLNDRITSEDGSVITYHLPDGEKMIVEEKSALEKSNTFSANLAVETNKATFYLKNNLKTGLSWNDINVATTGSYENRQDASLPNHAISNTFKLIKKFGKHIVTFESLNKWQSLKQSLTVLRNEQYSQSTRDHAFFTQEEASYGFKFKRIFVSLNGGVTAFFRDLDSRLQGIPDSLGIMDNSITSNYANLFITPSLEYKYRKIESGLEIPMDYYHYNFSHEFPNKNKWLTSPSLYIRWRATPQLRLTLRGSLSSSPGSLHDLYQGVILTDYRTLTSGTNEYATTSGKSISGSLNYKNPMMSGLFAYFTAIRSWGEEKFQYNQQFVGDFIMNSYVKSPSKSDAWTAIGSVSCSVDFLHGMAALNFLYRKNNRSMLSGTTPMEYDNENYRITGRMNGSLGEIINWQYQIDFGQNKLEVKELTKQRLNQWQHTFSTTLNPIEKLSVQLAGEYYNNEVMEKQYKDMLLLDTKLTYKLAGQIELSATLSNLFNKKTYNYTMYSDISSTKYERMVRGREVLVSLYLKK